MSALRPNAQGVTDMDLRLSLLQWEMTAISRWLGAFTAACPPRVGLERSGQTLWVKDFPLPDHFRPDRVSLALVVDKYPVEPPKGLYLLSEGANQELLQRLKASFNIFQDRGFHGAPSIEGFEWICLGYLNGWRHNPRAPQRGDNIQKMLAEFWRLLEEKK